MKPLTCPEVIYYFKCLKQTTLTIGSALIPVCMLTILLGHVYARAIGYDHNIVGYKTGACVTKQVRCRDTTGQLQYFDIKCQTLPVRPSAN